MKAKKAPPAAETATAYIDSFSGGVITVAAPHSGDTFAANQVVKAARSLTRDRIEDYVAAATADGPLLPIDSR